MIATGITIFLGLAAILAKLPRRMVLRSLKYGAAMDIAVTVVVLIIHWGTFSGVMGATVAGLLTSMATSGLKKLFGYIDGDLYHIGRIRLDI
jgi:nucleoside permease NupC